MYVSSICTMQLYIFQIFCLFIGPFIPSDYAVLLFSFLIFAILECKTDINKFHLQMVDRLDQGAMPAELGPLDYKGIQKARSCGLSNYHGIQYYNSNISFGFQAVAKALFRAHVEGQLKVIYQPMTITHDPYQLGI